jgi:O-antigen/teichoic acid export membrane protein
MLLNAGSLVGTTTITSGLGFVYWWVAARGFQPDAVGLAAAASSATLLLGSVGSLGIGTLLVSELPRHHDQRDELLATGVAVAAAGGAILALAFAGLVPLLAPELSPLARGLGPLALLTVGVALTSVAYVIDQVAVGMLRGHLQLLRNALFSAAKLIGLIAIAEWSLERGGVAIYASWAIGLLISMLPLVGLAISGRGWQPRSPLPWAAVTKLAPSAIGHHALNLVLQAPGLVLPLLATAAVGSVGNAYFYTAWMIAGFVFVGPTALASVLFAVGAQAPAELSKNLRFTLSLSVAVAIAGVTFAFVAGSFILLLFGRAYADQGAAALDLLALGVFPLIAKSHYVAVARARRKVPQAAWRLALGGFFELLLSGVGAYSGGIEGLALGWLVAVCIEAVFMLPSLYRTAMSSL